MHNSWIPPFNPHNISIKAFPNNVRTHQTYWNLQSLYKFRNAGWPYPLSEIVYSTLYTSELPLFSLLLGCFDSSPSWKIFEGTILKCPWAGLWHLHEPRAVTKVAHLYQWGGTGPVQGIVLAHEHWCPGKLGQHLLSSANTWAWGRQRKAGGRTGSRESRPMYRASQGRGWSVNLSLMPDPNSHPGPISLTWASQICTSDFTGADLRTFQSSIGLGC